MHQVLRLRNGKDVPDEEIRLILRAFIEKVSSYDQVVEVSLPMGVDSTR